MPQADATVIGTTGVWKSKRDNPRMTGTQTLLSWESVQVGGTLSPYGLNFELFNLTARTVRTNGGSTFSLWAFPSNNAAPSQPMTWVTRGTLLPRRTGTTTQDQLEIDAIYDHKSVTQGPIPWTNKARVVLDPDAHLLPIHVIQLFSSPAGYFNGWASDNMANVVFDDVTRTSQHINTTPTTNPDSVLHTWQKDGRSEELNILSPDDIWLQCGIQFRLISYSACEVPREVMTPSPTVCTNNALTQQAQAAINAADDCEAAQRGDGLRIIFTGKLVHNDCPTQVGGLTALGGNTAVVSPSALNWGSRTVTHELGHLLNLVDVTGDSNKDRLMFNNSNASTGNLLTAAECSTARGAALGKQSEWP